MPIQYARDDAHRRLMVTVEGPFQRSEILTVIERQRAEDTWSYGLLYDLRRITGHPTLAELREIMDEAAAWRAAEGPRSRRAPGDRADHVRQALHIRSTRTVKVDDPGVSRS
jgi:hypothetical protein